MNCMYDCKMHLIYTYLYKCKFVKCADPPMLLAFGNAQKNISIKQNNKIKHS